MEINSIVRNLSQSFADHNNQAKENTKQKPETVQTASDLNSFVARRYHHFSLWGTAVVDVVEWRA